MQTIDEAFKAGQAAVEARARGPEDILGDRRGVNDNRRSNHPHEMMRAAEVRFANAKSLAAGTRHLLKCAQALDQPGSFTRTGANEITVLCQQLLTAIKNGASADDIGRLSMGVGASWGQLKTRASI